MPTILRPPLVTPLGGPRHVGAALHALAGVWANRLLDLLQSQDQFFGAAGQPPSLDHALPPRGPRPSVALLTWLDPYKLLLQSQDQFFGLAGQPTFEWPVPRGPVAVRGLPAEGPNLVLTLLALAQPFAQLDWPLPGRRPFVPPEVIGDAHLWTLLVPARRGRPVRFYPGRALHGPRHTYPGRGSSQGG